MSDKNPPASGFQYSLTNLKPAEPVQKVTLTFPDGARREYPKSTTGLEIAKGISPSLAKRTVAMALDGQACRPQRSNRERCEDRTGHRATIRARSN